MVGHVAAWGDDQESGIRSTQWQENDQVESQARSGTSSKPVFKSSASSALPGRKSVGSMKRCDINAETAKQVSRISVSTQCMMETINTTKSGFPQCRGT